MEAGPSSVVVESSSGESQSQPGPPSVRLRYLAPSDIPSVKRLCGEIFPIEYPEYWYSEIATNPAYFSLAAVGSGGSGGGSGGEALVGLLVAEVKRLSVASAEDRDMLCRTFPANTAVAYILSLGVTEAWRRAGVASKLLQHLLDYVGSGVGPGAGVRAVYLHVLCDNLTAIRFYERRRFRRHKRLLHYYQINSVPRDGYAYVLYVNGGRPARGVLEAAVAAAAAAAVLPCRLSLLLLRLPARLLSAACPPSKLFTRARLCLLHPDHAHITY